MSRSIEGLKIIFDYLNKTKAFEQHMRNVKILSLDSGKCKAEFAVTKDNLNINGTFHEGLTTTLVDVVSSWVLFTYGNGFSGLSSNIHVSHLQPAFLGEVLSIDAKVLRVANPLAFVEVELSKNNGEAIVARGQHTLFIKPMQPDYKTGDKF